MAVISNIEAGGTLYDIEAQSLGTTNTIDGVEFDGDDSVSHYAYCSTAAATAAKEASLNGFSLVTGARISVKFQYANTAANPTLNISSTGAVAIMAFGTTAAASGEWSAGEIVEFIFDGTYFLMEKGAHATSTARGNVMIDSTPTSGSGNAVTSGGVYTAVTAAQDAADEAQSWALAAFATDIATGAFATFTDGADDVPVKDLSIEIEPAQAGSGDPSPDNIRAITGFTGANIGVSGDIPTEDWEKVKIAGAAKYPVGTQINISVNGNNMAFDVEGYGEEISTQSDTANVVSLVMNKVLRTVPFDPAQFLFAVTEDACTEYGWSTSMPAGKYKVTLDHAAYGGGTGQDGTYVFTTTQAIPVGGGVRHSVMGQDGKAKSDVLAGTFITYGADKVTTLETLATSEYNADTDSDAVSLGTATAKNSTYKVGNYINFTECQRYGSNRWSTSWIRQYLNSADATLAWTPKTIWSRPINSSIEGFLYNLDASLRAALTKIRKRYAIQSTYGGGYEDIEDYVTLDTMTDVIGGANNNIYEGAVNSNGILVRNTQMSLWKDINTTQASRIKYNSSNNASLWWLGSMNPVFADRVRHIYTSGALGYDNALNSDGIAPRLQLIVDDTTTYTVDWTDEAGTVYGGALDVTTGVLTVTTKHIALQASDISSYNTTYVATNIISGIAVPASTSTATTGICSHYVATNQNRIGVDNNSFVVAQSRQILITDTANVTSLDDYKAYVTAQAAAGTPIQFVLPLETPLTYQLTAQQVNTLLGDNSIFSDTNGNVTVNYRADTALYIDKKLNA